jgi:hypothetical protein
LLLPQDQLPPAPGVDTPLAFASRVPAMVPLPNTARTTGRFPVTRSVAPDASVKFCMGSTTMDGPLVCVCTTGVGSV